MPSSHLSPEVNANLLRLQLNGGLNYDRLPNGSLIEVKTKNTTYQVRKLAATDMIKGSEKYCPDWTACYVSGSTWGGSMIVPRFIGNGMFLEFRIGDSNKVVVTTAIRSAKVL